MSAFCGCFKSQPQTNDSGKRNRKKGGGRGVRLDNQEMDLLEMNKRGMDGIGMGDSAEDDQWTERHEKNNRASQTRDDTYFGDGKVIII